MAESDWAIAGSSLPQGTVDRGVTSAGPRPNGGGQFIHGFASLSASANGAVARYVDLANFNPTNTGARISAALQRGTGANDTGFSTFIFCALQGSSVNDVGYMLGLSDADPARLILRKGVLSAGIPDLTPDPTVNGNLLASTDTYLKGTWVHVELTAITNDNGDVILQVRQNDLDTDPVTAPVWTTPPGLEGSQATEPDGPIDGFIDDTLQINTGSAPLPNGFVGFGFAVVGSARSGFVDHVSVYRQT
jgi:hypothetical protein